MHAILAPSAAHRWVNCPGSVQAEQQYPDSETESAREGTATHEIAAELVQRAARAGGWNWSDFDGKAASNGVVFTEEMFEGAVLYAEDVQKRMRDTGVFGGDNLKVEQPVTIPRVHDLNWGTPDCVIWDQKNGRLIVWDFKFGRVPVENRENWQLIEYAIGSIDAIPGMDGLKDQHITVEMRIVQPRAFHPDGVCREWSIQGSDLRGFANQLKHSADVSQQENPPCKSGEWCDNCTAARGCMTLQRETARINDRVETLQLIDLTPEDSAIELRYLRRAQTLLESRLEALEAQALEQIRGGTVVPGFGIGYGRGSLAWNKSDAEVIALGDVLGVDLRKAEAPITPTQAKKLNVDEAVINSYSEKRQGSARLVTDDKTIAGRVFSNS